MIITRLDKSFLISEWIYGCLRAVEVVYNCMRHLQRELMDGEIKISKHVVELND